MSKLIYFNRQQTGQGTATVAINRPTQPVDYKRPGTENRIADPSSCTPKGQCYPIPSFFDYRAKPRDLDAI